MKYLFLYEGYDNNIYYHGSTNMLLLGKNGIHIGTYKAAKEALEARIGVPAEGEWDGNRKYGETLLAGKNTLTRIEKEEKRFVETGYNCGYNVPFDDYLPSQRNKLPTYSDGSTIDLECKPIIFPVRIIGNMINSRNNPYDDFKANSIIKRTLKRNAINGIYYINCAEDEGSISAVVPNGSFLKIV